MVEIAPPTFVLGSTTLEIQKEQDSDHDQGENQKLSLYQALSLKTLLADYLLLIAYEVAKAKEDNDEKHKPSARYHNASQELRVVIPRPELLPGLHVQRTYDYSQKWFFLSVWSHAQLTLASHCVRHYPQCVIGKFGHTFKFVHSMSSSSSSLSYCPVHPLESSLLSTLAPSSSSSDENAQSFTLRAPNKLKTTTQVVALNRCC
ncbi:hypothetical protein HID58_066747 [Brassica napus]|uniref:Uncharacterized protein n=1 Tax=Brassica napus TaxID=3708 RepID=A0ABQ7ZGY9_BRANA|nr:hypothetical protein HID58_066747 [Brassica napus]